jgi:hypothetical protein
MCGLCVVNCFVMEVDGSIGSSLAVCAASSIATMISTTVQRRGCERKPCRSYANAREKIGPLPSSEQIYCTEIGEIA